MSDPSTSAAPVAGRTAWARGLEQPLRAFLRTETGSAAVLLAATIAALIWANVDASSYRTLWGTQMSIRVGGFGVSQDLRQWVNAGLMTFFFFVVGLEARREFDIGEVRERPRGPGSPLPPPPREVGAIAPLPPFYLRPPPAPPWGGGDS